MANRVLKGAYREVWIEPAQTSGVVQIPTSIHVQRPAELNRVWARLVINNLTGSPTPSDPTFSISPTGYLLVNFNIVGGTIAYTLEVQWNHSIQQARDPAYAGLGQVLFGGGTGGGGGGVPPARRIDTGNGLSGGGDLTVDRTHVVVPNPDGSVVVSPAGVGVGVLASDAQHGVRGGGNQHSLATALVAGFMSPADFSKLAGLPATAVPTTRTLTAGAGLTGGGDLSADRTFNVGANADGSIVVNADDIQVGVLATDAQHGVRGGGTQHALVTTVVAGFMSPADKTLLDSLSGSGPVLFTPEGGFALKMNNNTGSAIPKGRIVCSRQSLAASGYSNEIEPTPVPLANQSDMPIGVVYDAGGIPSGGSGWVVIAGRADVDVENVGLTFVGSGWVVYTTTVGVSGQGTAAPSVPATVVHFREAGHTLAERAAASTALIRCILHFN